MMSMFSYNWQPVRQRLLVNRSECLSTSRLRRRTVFCCVCRRARQLPQIRTSCRRSADNAHCSQYDRLAVRIRVSSINQRRLLRPLGTPAPRLRRRQAWPEAAKPRRGTARNSDGAGAVGITRRSAARLGGLGPRLPSPETRRWRAERSQQAPLIYRRNSYSDGKTVVLAAMSVVGGSTTTRADLR